MSTLRPVSRATTAQACADQLRSAILTGELSAGVRLPAERTLALQLGVTRVTLRTALTQLAAQGLVEQVQGRGTTVLDYRRSASLDLLADLARVSAEDPVAVARDLLGVRRSLAHSVLETLARVRPDPTPIAAAVAHFTEVAAASPTNEHALAEADLAVIAALLDATGSTVLAMCFRPVAHALAVHPGLRAAVYRDPTANALGWAALLAWITDPHPEQLPALIDLLHARDVDTIAALESAP